MGALKVGQIEGEVGNIKGRSISEVDDEKLDTLVKSSLRRVDVVSKDTMEMAIDNTIVQNLEEKLYQLLEAKKVMTRKPYEYERTLVFIGVKHDYSEDPVDIANNLITHGLNLHHIKPVRATGLGNESKGIFKVELNSEDDKIVELRNSAQLRHYTNYGSKVVVRSSTSFEHRVLSNNFRMMMNCTGLDKTHIMNKHSQIVEGNYQYSRGQRYQNVTNYTVQQGLINPMNQPSQYMTQDLRLTFTPRMIGMYNSRNNIPIVNQQISHSTPRTMNPQWNQIVGGTGQGTNIRTIDPLTSSNPAITNLAIPSQLVNNRH